MDCVAMRAWCGALPWRWRAISYVARHPLRVIPTLMARRGGRAHFMLFGCTLRALHGAMFVLLIPGAVGNVDMYLASVTVGTVAVAALVKLPSEEVEGS
jgi:PTS system fructose-specific IIC component